MQPSGGGKQNEEGALWFQHQWTMQAGIRQGGRRIESQQPAALLLATLACACAPPPAVSRNKKVSQDKRKMASVSLSIESV